MTPKKLWTLPFPHKQLFGIFPGMGGGQVVYMLPFSWVKRETHKRNSQESQENARVVPEQSRDNPVKVFCLCVS